MNAHNPRINLGPIGVVASPGGQIGIGIGVPMMAGVTHPIVPRMTGFPPQPQKKLVSPDSSDDKDKFVAQLFAQHSSTNTNSGAPNNQLSWINPSMFPRGNCAGVFPMMGIMGHSSTENPSILYGLIGTGVPNSNMNVNMPTQNSLLNLPSIPEPIGGGLRDNFGGALGINVPSVESKVSIMKDPLPQKLQCKDIIHCKSCTLFPPNPSAPLPTTREKPPGCRTVFVGGLPENITEEMIREIFGNCGEILTIRMSKKNFCHVRFEQEESIEDAIYLSGYRVRVGSNSDAPNVGRLHVDYAQARDDLYEFECRQRQLSREQRHRERIEKERLMPPSPPCIPSYSDHEAMAVAEKIKSDETFIKGIHTLIAWLEKGDCVKRNSTTFYSMIQSTNSHIRRLMSEKSQYEEDMQNARDIMRQRMTGLLLSVSQIEKVFVSSCHKKAWDHFSKPQRKHIEMWRKQATEIKNMLLEEALAERNDEEMDVSDSECDFKKCAASGNPSAAKKSKWDTMIDLKEENYNLRCQLEASNNEVDMMKEDLRIELEGKDEQLKLLQKLAASNGETTESISIDCERLQKPCTYTTTPNTIYGLEEPEENNCDCSSSTNGNSHSQNIQSYSSITNNQNNGAAHMVSISDTDARLIGVISTFLHVHPFGCSLDYIWSYVMQVNPTVRANDIEALMCKLPTLFRQDISGIGATLEKKWVFVGFN